MCRKVNESELEEIWKKFWNPDLTKIDKDKWLKAAHNGEGWAIMLYYRAYMPSVYRILD
jgi:hypothetical protein